MDRGAAVRRRDGVYLLGRLLHFGLAVVALLVDLIQGQMQLFAKLLRGLKKEKAATRTRTEKAKAGVDARLRLPSAPPGRRSGRGRGTSLPCRPLWPVLSR